MLVGRVAEQRQLDELLAQARAGISGVLVLRGEPGIGKTALADYAAGQAQAPAQVGSAVMRVLRAAGVEAEAELAFAGLYSLLHQLTGYLSAMPERQAAALEAALGRSGLASSDAAPDRLAVAAGTHGLLTAAAEDQALLIVVDDLHWVDAPSREALLFALRRLDRDAIACVLTVRADGPASAPAGLPCRDLRGLALDPAAQLISQVAGTAPAAHVAAQLHAETAGNPLALAELSAALTQAQLAGAELPRPLLPPGAAIRERFAVRIDQLSVAAKTALLIAAAAGRCPAADLSAAMLRLGDTARDGGAQPIGPALGEAESAGLVRVTPDGISFAHPLLRSVAYHALPPARRRAAHRALAGVFAGRDPERAAWHLAAAATGADEEAATALETAAVTAAAKGAPQAAAAAWERAAGLSPDVSQRFRRMARAAEAALSGGELEQAIGLSEPAAAGETTPDCRARMLAVRGRVHMLTGQMAAAHRELREAADLTAVADPGLAAELLSVATDAAFDGGLPDAVGEIAGLLADLARQPEADDAVAFLADIARGNAAWEQGGDPRRGMFLIHRAVSRLDASPVLSANPRHQIAISGAWSQVGEFSKARRCAEYAIELAQRTGALGDLPGALDQLSFCDQLTGRWPQALAHASQTLDLARQTGQPLLAAEALVMMAEIEAAQGRDAASREHAREADRLADELGLRRLQYTARRSHALLEHGRGRADEAITRYEELRTLAIRWDLTNPYYSVVPDLIELYVAAGKRDQAAELLAEFLVMVPDGHPPAAARAARCRGILAADDYDRHFQEAIAQHERGEVAFHHARTRLCYGERLRRAQRRRDARVQLRAAAEIFDRLDARPWAERARAELRASGETINVADRQTQQLTPQELQIALLVTEGKTNAEIGRTIFLSTRTVEFHLSRAYRKLGVSSRAELTRHLTSAGTV